MTTPSAAELFGSSVNRPLVMSAKPGWSAFNPSIAYSPVEGYKCIVRSSNYVITRGQYEYPGYIDTRNWIANLDDDLRIVGMQEINQEPVRGDVLYRDVLHMEDARLIWHDGGYWQVSGTLREARSDGVCRIAVDRLEDWQSVERRLLPSPAFDLRHEKNWMPISDGRFVYDAATSQVVDEKGQYSPQMSIQAIGWDLRGGSQVVALPWGEHLAVVHEVQHHPGGRQYLNRFVLFDADMVLRQVSHLFYFERPTIEFAAGMTLWNDQVVVSYGLDDRLAMLSTVPLYGVMSALHNVD